MKLFLSFHFSLGTLESIVLRSQGMSRNHLRSKYQTCFDLFYFARATFLFSDEKPDASWCVQTPHKAILLAGKGELMCDSSCLDVFK